MRYIKDDAGNLYRTFKTPELAIKFYTEEYKKYASEDDEKIDSDTECSFAVAVDFDDPEQEKTFCVAGYGRFTNCTIADIEEWEDWYDDKWLVPVVHNEFKEIQSLRDFFAIGDGEDGSKTFVSITEGYTDNVVFEAFSIEDLFAKLAELVEQDKSHPEESSKYDIYALSSSDDFGNDFIFVGYGDVNSRYQGVTAEELLNNLREDDQKKESNYASNARY